RPASPSARARPAPAPAGRSGTAGTRGGRPRAPGWARPGRATPRGARRGGGPRRAAWSRRARPRARGAPGRYRPAASRRGRRRRPAPPPRRPSLLPPPPLARPRPRARSWHARRPQGRRPPGPGGRAGPAPTSRAAAGRATRLGRSPGDASARRRRARMIDTLTDLIDDPGFRAACGWAALGAAVVAAVALALRRRVPLAGVVVAGAAVAALDRHVLPVDDQVVLAL